MDCEKNFKTSIWQYYTIIDGDIWHRQSQGFHKNRFPFITELPKISDSDTEWIAGTRWERGDGLKCSGSELATLPVEAATEQIALQTCTEKCLEHQECVAIHFPKLGEGDKWNSGAGEAN